MSDKNCQAYNNFNKMLFELKNKNVTYIHIRTTRETIQTKILQVYLSYYKYILG